MSASASSTLSVLSANPAGTPVRLFHAPSKSSRVDISQPAKLFNDSIPEMSIEKEVPGAATVTSISSFATSSAPAVETPSDAPAVTASTSLFSESIACCTSFTLSGR